MSSSNIQLIKSIREKTGLSLKEIKKVVESDSSLSEEKIIEKLRKDGILKQKSSERAVNNGKVFSYVHEGRIGVLLEIKCETDFVARSDAFNQLGDNICLHIAAYRPAYLSVDSIDQEFLSKEIEIARSQLVNENKPDNIIEKILEGKKKKIAEESSLLSQPFIKDPNISVNDYILSVSNVTGERIELTRFEIYVLS